MLQIYSEDESVVKQTLALTLHTYIKIKVPRGQGSVQSTSESFFTISPLPKQHCTTQVSLWKLPQCSSSLLLHTVIAHCNYIKSSEGIVQVNNWSPSALKPLIILKSRRKNCQLTPDKTKQCPGVPCMWVFCLGDLTQQFNSYSSAVQVCWTNN